jgi:type VI secretion system secreted protein VgrG
MHMTTPSIDFAALARERQHKRMLRLSFPHGDGPAALLLLPNRLEAREELSRDFEFKVELLAENARIRPEDLQGKMVSIELVRGDGSLRYFNGYVHGFRLLRTDGGIAFYRMVLKPWLAYLRLRKDCYLFHGLSLYEQTASVFGDYGPCVDWDCQLRSPDPAVTEACQFNESDHNYLHRRWEAMGWHYWYEHSAHGHKLKLSDNSTYAEAIDGGGEVAYQRHAGACEEDGIGDWSPARQVAASSVALSSFDFKDPRPRHAGVPTLNGQGAVPALESYEYTGARGFADQRDGDRLSALRMEEIEAASQHCDGAGNNTFVQPGRSFIFTGYIDAASGAAAREFLVISVWHEASNNYLQGADQPARYGNRLLCIRKNISWRPGRGRHSKDTRIYGVQSATVVGPAGENICVDQYGRVRVQFHWDRVGTNDERSSAPVRVMSGWAGAELGFGQVLRVGQSVLLQWFDGNCDRPVIIGTVANWHNMPAWALPQQQSLTGIRSRELVPGGGNAAGGRGGHLVFDDCHGRIQTQLKSDLLYSQLALGHIARIDGNAGRKEGRGQGFELRTDGVGVLRAAEGLLLTSEARPNGLGHITDMGETLQRLAQAHALHDSLAGLAKQHQAQDGDADQGAAAAAIKAQNDAIKGGDAGDGGFPELAEPHLVLASPSGIEATSAASTHLASGEHIALTAGSHLSLAAGKSLYASVAEKFSVFVHRMGMRLIAASGKVQIQAQTDDLELLAQKVLDIISTTGWIHLKAKEGISLEAGGSGFVVCADGIKGITPGVNHVHAADHQTFGPESVETEFPGAKVCPSQTAGAAQSGGASVPLA